MNTFTATKVARFEANFRNEWTCVEKDAAGMIVWVCNRIGKDAAIAACKAHLPTHTKTGT